MKHTQGTSVGPNSRDKMLAVKKKLFKKKIFVLRIPSSWVKIRWKAVKSLNSDHSIGKSLNCCEAFPLL